MNQLLKQPFNLEKHKKEFKNTYLEVVISPQGIVHYAVPSHTEKLIEIACKKHKITREELEKRTPAEYYANWCLYLCRLTGYIAVWDKFVDGDINIKQNQTLIHLMREGLYQYDTFIDVFKVVDYKDIPLYTNGTNNMTPMLKVLKKYPKKVKGNEVIIKIRTKKRNLRDETRDTYTVDTEGLLVDSVSYTPELLPQLEEKK